MEAAKKYVEFKNRLDMANAQYVHRQYMAEEEKLKYTQDNIEKVQKEIDELQQKKTELAKQIEENNAAITAKEEEIAAQVGPEYNEVKKNIPRGERGSPGRAVRRKGRQDTG